MIPLPQKILVLWHSPRTNDLLPIGLLSIAQGSPRFRFWYVKRVAAAREQGFALFLEFPDLHRDYASDQLFPLFANRLMSRSRPDYAAWVERHGLTAGTADEESLLVRADGHRATDRVELLALPTRGDGRSVLTTWFFVRGVPKDREELVTQLVPNQQLFLADREELRTGLRTASGVLLGYMPNSDAFRLQDAVRDAVLPVVYVERINPPPAPIHHRVLCRLEIPFETAPGFLGSDLLEPIPSSASPWSSG